METTADDPQAMLHPSGKFVIPIMHYRAREQRRLIEEQRKLGITPANESKSKNVKQEDPPHLKCPICNNLFTDAVSVSCCESSFCAECVHQKIVEAGIADIPYLCPLCNEKIGAQNVRDNHDLRDAVSKYKKSLLNPLTIQSSIDVTSELLIKPKVRLNSFLNRELMIFQQETETKENAEESIPSEPVKLPTVNLSAMLAKKSDTPPLPDISQPPPPVIPLIPETTKMANEENTVRVGLSGSDENFKVVESVLPPLPPKMETKHKSDNKGLINGIELNDRDRAAIDRAWEKLAAVDDVSFLEIRSEVKFHI